MSQRQSLLVTLANRTFDGLDLQQLASRLELPLVRLSGDSVAEIFNSEQITEEPALYAGTGDYNFDAQLAAALGAPVLLAAGDETAAKLAEARIGELGATVASISNGDFDNVEPVDARQVMSPVVFERQLIEQARANRKHVVLPEGEDDRILQAADQLLKQGVAELTILGDVDDMNRRAADLGLDLSGARLVNHLESELAEEFAAEFAELRKKKGVTIEEARETMKDVSYFGTMMVHLSLIHI